VAADTGVAVAVIGDEPTLPRPLRHHRIAVLAPAKRREPTPRHHTTIERTLINVQPTNPARVATRYGKLAANYLAFLKLASIRLLLRDSAASEAGLIALVIF
jgi:hypothetical protein